MLALAARELARADATAAADVALHLRHMVDSYVRWYCCARAGVCAAELQAWPLIRDGGGECQVCECSVAVLFGRLPLGSESVESAAGGVPGHPGQGGDGDRERIAEVAVRRRPCRAWGASFQEVLEASRHATLPGDLWVYVSGLQVGYNPGYHRVACLASSVIA